MAMSVTRENRDTRTRTERLALVRQRRRRVSRGIPRLGVVAQSIALSADRRPKREAHADNSHLLLAVVNQESIVAAVRHDKLIADLHNASRIAEIRS